MNVRTAFVATLVLIPLQVPAVSVPLDVTGVQPGPISVVRGDGSVTVTWPDETARVWRATFSLNPAQPLITSIGPDGEAVVRGARPFYQGETGKRRGGWYALLRRSGASRSRTCASSAARPSSGASKRPAGNGRGWRSGTSPGMARW